MGGVADQVIENMLRKGESADAMFAELVSHMSDSESLRTIPNDVKPVEVPAWA